MKRLSFSQKDSDDRIVNDVQSEVVASIIKPLNGSDIIFGNVVAAQLSSCFVNKVPHKLGRKPIGVIPCLQENQAVVCLDRECDSTFIYVVTTEQTRWSAWVF